MNNTEQNILKGCGNIFDKIETSKWGEIKKKWVCSIGGLCPSCKKLFEGYQLAKKENQSQQTKPGLIKPGTALLKSLNVKTTKVAADTQLQKYKKETAEKVEKLLERIREWEIKEKCKINGRETKYSRFRNMVIEIFKEKIA